MASCAFRRHADQLSFSPLHEGDTSVARRASIGHRDREWFQSPSRGGHLRGTPPGSARHPPSTPFQSPSRGGHLRGTKPLDCQGVKLDGFSPLHEGDTSVALTYGQHEAVLRGFSPLHEGDTSVAHIGGMGQSPEYLVSVPFTRGTPPWRACARRPHQRSNVSVPFTRGTPPWRTHSRCSTWSIRRFSPLHEGDTSVAWFFRAL